MAQNGFRERKNPSAVQLLVLAKQSKVQLPLPQLKSSLPGGRSASSDAGAGIAAALGLPFLDDQNKRVRHGLKGLKKRFRRLTAKD